MVHARFTAVCRKKEGNWQNSLCFKNLKKKQWHPPNGCSETCLYILPMLWSVQCTYTVCTLYSTYSDYEA